VEPGTLERLGLGREGASARSAARLPQPRGLALAGRLAAGAAAGGLAAAALELPSGAPPVSPLAAGTAVAIAVMLLPRIAWIAAVAAIGGWYLLPATGMQGAALVLFAAAAPVPLLMPRAGLLWSVPALAPLLAFAGLGPLFVVAAGFASTVWRRAGLAAAGFLWLAIAEVASGRTLLFGPAHGSTSHHEWERSIGTAADHALAPLVTSAALLPALLWAALAVLLPLAVRGRSLTLDLLGALAWTAAVIAGHQSIGRVLADGGQHADARGLAVGALLAAVAAVAAAEAGIWRAPRLAPGGLRMAGSP
jgi:hypothetical protein